MPIRPTMSSLRTFVAPAARRSVLAALLALVVAPSAAGATGPQSLRVTNWTGQPVTFTAVALTTGGAQPSAVPNAIVASTGERGVAQLPIMDGGSYWVYYGERAALGGCSSDGLTYEPFGPFPQPSTFTATVRLEPLQEPVRPGLSSDERQFVWLVNRLRMQHAAHPMQIDAALSRAADAHAHWLDGFFSPSWTLSALVADKYGALTHCGPRASTFLFRIIDAGQPDVYNSAELITHSPNSQAAFAANTLDRGSATAGDGGAEHRQVTLDPRWGCIGVGASESRWVMLVMERTTDCGGLGYGKPCPQMRCADEQPQLPSEFARTIWCSARPLCAD